MRHREFVSDVKNSSAGAFEVVSFNINPALSKLFPWLCSLAQAFESYSFRSLSFEYQPIVGTIEHGMVMLAVDYDAADPLPGSKTQMMQTFGATRSSVWSPVTLHCQQANLRKLPQRYTRKTDPFSGIGDIKTYDAGQLLVATEATATALPKGELYVSYDIELITPQPVVFTPEIVSAKAVSLNSTAAAPFSGATVTQGVELLESTLGSAIKFKRPGEYSLDFAINVPNATTGDGLVIQNATTGVSVAQTGYARLADFISANYRVKVPKRDSSFEAVLSGPGNPTSAVLRAGPYAFDLL